MVAQRVLSDTRFLKRSGSQPVVAENGMTLQNRPALQEFEQEDGPAFANPTTENGSAMG